jgi:hypothetical protein
VTTAAKMSVVLQAGLSEEEAGAERGEILEGVTAVVALATWLIGQMHPPFACCCNSFLPMFSALSPATEMSPRCSNR